MGVAGIQPCPCNREKRMGFLRLQVPGCVGNQLYTLMLNVLLRELVVVYLGYLQLVGLFLQE